jgi:hypothetical protein
MEKRKELLQGEILRPRSGGFLEKSILEDSSDSSRATLACGKREAAARCGVVEYWHPGQSMM